MAVAALQDGIDPVGACVGMRGIRIQNIVKELHNEKIDVIEWNNDAVAFISKALSPARVTGVYLDDDPVEGRTAVVLVPDDQLSLAIGREGQNARLAAKLTGWRIDIKSVTETVQNALENLELPPLDSLTERHADLIAESLRIMEKKRLELAVMPEEYKALARFANIVEQLLQEERDQTHESFLEQREAARATLAPQLFELPLDVLAVSQEVLDILEPYENIGEVMLHCAIDEELVSRKFVELEGEPMAELRAALDIVESADLDQLLAEAFSIEAGDDEEAAIDETAEEGAEEPAADAEPEAVSSDEAEAEAEQPPVMLDAFGQPVEESQTEEPAAAPEEIAELVGEAAAVVDGSKDAREARPAGTDDGPQFVEEEGEREFELDRQKGKLQRRKDRQKRRQLVLDEESGEVIAKRRRKGRRGGWDEEVWEDYDY